MASCGMSEVYCFEKKDDGVLYIIDCVLPYISYKLLQTIFSVGCFAMRDVLCVCGVGCVCVVCCVCVLCVLCIVCCVFCDV